MWLVPKSTSIDYFTQLFLIAADWGTIPHVISSHFSPYMKLATTNHIVFVMKICLRILEWLKKLKPFGRNCCNKYWGTYSLYEIQIKKIHTLITLLYPFSANYELHMSISLNSHICHLFLPFLMSNSLCCPQTLRMYLPWHG